MRLSKGHGRGAIVYKRSDDGGLTWSDRLPTPASRAASQEVPTLHRVDGPDGTKRIIPWSGLYPARLAVSKDDGATWGELKPVGDWGGIVVMGFVEPLKTCPCCDKFGSCQTFGMYLSGSAVAPNWMSSLMDTLVQRACKSDGNEKIS